MIASIELADFAAGSSIRNHSAMSQAWTPPKERMTNM